jgi:hypothetical protein
MAQCGWCGGSLHVRSRDHGRQRAFFYACTSYRLRGTTVCRNNPEVPMGGTDRAVLATVGQDLLQPAVIERVIRKVLERLRPDPSHRDAQHERLAAELLQVDEELAGLTAAIGDGGRC